MTRYKKNGDPINEIVYEWVIEWMDENGDIIDNDHSDTLSDYFMAGLERQPAALALIRRVGNEDDGEVDRGYAYVKDGEIEPEFDCGHKVPAKYKKIYGSA